MKTNILISTWIGFGKVISRTYSRLDSLSIVSRQSVLAILVACLTVLGVGNAWGATYTYDFSSCTASSGGAMTYWYSDANCTTHLAKFTSGTTNQIISSGGTGTATIYYKDASIPSTAFTITAGNTAYFMSGSSASTAFLWGKTAGNYITLPTYSGEVITKVKVTTSSGVGKSIEVNIYSGTYAASTSYTTTGCTPNGCDNTQYNEFTISDTYQASSLKLQIVTDSKNFQITEIQITTASACDKSVTVTAGNSSTNGSISTITGSPVATCDASASNRTVTITVSPNTGYVAPSELSFSVTSGNSVTATRQSGPTNNVYVYSFAQNDNNSTCKVNVACVGKQCTLIFNQNGGEGGQTSNLTATYGSAMPAISGVPTRDHYDFDGYYDGAGGTGNKYYNSDGTSAINWNKNTTANTTLYAKWTEHSLTNYRTVCCLPLTTVSGAISVGSINETGGTASWSWSGATTGISKNILKVYNTSDVLVKTIDNISASATSQSISGLDPCTSYYVTLTTVASSGYCAGEEQGKSSNFTTNGWAVHYTGGDENEGALLSNVTKVTGASQACLSEDYVATFTANTGYKLPDNIVVYIAGVEVDVDDAYTWSISNGTGTLTVETDDLSEEIDVRIIGECVEPEIGTDPESASYQQGASPSALTVAATLASGTLTYQWQKSTDGGDNWSNESGTGYNTATYAAANISTAAVGTTKYRCIVGNSEGGCTVTSGVATITITAAANFVNGTTVFIQAESNSAWDASACVKAWFNNNGAGGAAQTTYWLFDAGSPDTGKKLYAAVVPASGDLNQVTLQRFASNCSDFYNNNGTLTKASDGGSNTFRTTGSGNSNVAWNGSGLTMSLMSSDNWNTSVATVTDQGAGVWTGTYEYTPSNTSTEYIVATNYNGNIGNTGNNSNATLSGMIVGSTYNVTATLNVISHSLSMSKTFVKGTVHFDLQGHGLAIADLTNVMNGSTIDAPSEPSEFGYTFGGWFKEPACTNEWDFENDGVSETMTLYAKWTANVYTITKTFSNVANASLPASFTYTGSTTTDLNSTFTVDADNFFLPSSITVTMGGTPLTVGTDYTYNNSTGAFTFLRIINADIVITASATAKLTGIAITTQPNTRKYLAGESFSSAGAVVRATMGDESTKDVTASVTWTPSGALSAGTGQTVTATYTENGVEKTATTTIDVYSVTINKVNMNGDAIENANVTVNRDGYTLSQSVGGTNYLFNSWNVTAGGVTISDNTITGTPNANVVINAKFHDPITVTWKVGIGAASGSPTTEVKYGTKISALPSTPADDAVARCGANKFMGWTAGGKIEGTGHDAPADLFNSTSDAGCVALTANTTYRAVFATRGPGYKDTTIVEDFEKQSTGTIYNTTVEYSKDNSNAKIGWVMYYGTNSTSGPIKGSKSAQMRWYNSALENYPYIKSTTQLRSLSNIKFSARVGNTDVKMDVAYSDDNGDSWTPIATKVAFADTYKKAFSYNIPGVDATNYLIKIGVNSESDPPASNYSLLVDSVAFTYKTPTTITADYITGCCTPLAAIGGEVEFSNPTTAVLTWNDMSNVADSNPYVVTYRTGSDPYGSSNVSAITTNGAGKKTCTITGLSCNTAYDFKIAVTAAEDYCNIDSVMTATSTKYSITKGSTTGGSFTTKISTDDVTEACNGATIAIAATPSAGYTFSSWTITKEGGGTVEPAASSASTSFTMPSDNVTVTPTFSCIVPNHIDITGRWDRFGGETISLTATAYATEGTGSPIPAADITGYKWQKWYNEQWNDVSDGGNISGTSTNNLVITNSIGGNSGSYRCVVTTGATCLAYSSDGREVKVFALECYTGGTTSYNFTRDGENERGSVEVTLAANTAYTFKIHADNVYYGNSGTVNEDVADWLCTIGAGNLTVNSGLGGTFTFTMDYSSAGSSSTVGDPEISVTYPRKTIYLTPGVWATGDAKFAFYYFRKENETIYGEGFTDFITAGDCGSSAEIPQWNGVKINAVRLNSNTTVEELTNPANHYKAAWDKKWNQTSDITISNYNSITITGMGGGGDSPYDYGTYSVPTYTISYATGSTTYTGGNAISGSKASESKTCGEDFTLPNAAVFTTTGYTQTGWATSDGGSQAYAFGGSYATNAAQAFYPAWTANTHSLSWSANGGDALTGDYTTGTVAYGTTIVAPDTPTKTGYTFAGWHNGTAVVTPESTMPDNDLSYTAQWSLATYQVTLTTNGGTINAGNVTSYTYGTGATLPTNVTRDGYRFDGWFDNSGLTGDVVTTISSSATGDKAFWAKWTKIHTVTWNVNGSTYNTGVVEGNTLVISGGKISAPATAPADNTLSACASKFMGWSCKNFGSTPKTTESGQYDDLFTDVAGSPYITQDTTFYAVFAEASDEKNWSMGTITTIEDGATMSYANCDGEHTVTGSDGNDYTYTSSNVMASGGNQFRGSSYYGRIYNTTSLGQITKIELVAGSYVTEMKVYESATSITASPGSGAITPTVDGSKYTYEFSGKGFFLIIQEGSHAAKANVTVYFKDVPSNYRTECDANLVKVTYDANGGSTSCTNTTTDKTEDFTVCATEPTKDYYEFAGWLCSADSKTYAASATIDDAVIDADFSLTAQWTPVPYDITYNLYGGTNSGSNPATYNVETATITLQDPTKGHDRFEGWFSTYSAGVYSDQVTSIPLGSHGDITLHAKWAERHHIEFFKEGVSIGEMWRADDENMEDDIAGQGSIPSDPDAPSACSSKVFVGWSESEIDDETDDEPADLMKPAAGTVNEDKEFHAVWAIEESSSGTETIFTDDFNVTGTDEVTSRSGWTDLSTVYGGSGSIRFSSGKNAGSMTLDVSGMEMSGTWEIKFKIKKYGSDGSGALAVSSAFEDVTTSFSPTSVSTTDGANWTEKTITVTGVHSDTEIHFDGTANSRVYVKDVEIKRTGTITTHSAYSTSCCATKVTLSQNSPENGTIAFGKTSVGTCGGDKDVSLTITPAAGYQLHSYEVATGDGKVATKTDPGISLDNNSSAVQNITLTFASGASGAYDVTASFSEMVVTNWSWTNHDGGAALTTDPIEIYVDQQARVDVTYTPAKAELLSTHTAASYYNHDATGSAYVRNPNKASEYFTFYGKASTGDETTVITLTHNDDTSNPKTFPQLIYVKVLPLPLVHFEDLVHGKEFADVAATIVENALSATKTTPTSDDWTTPNANTCEENHLHLVGWIREDWPALVAYLAGTGDQPSTTAITTAGNDDLGNAYFFTAGASINVQTFDGVTFYAVWGKME